MWVGPARGEWGWNPPGETATFFYVRSNHRAPRAKVSGIQAQEGLEYGGVRSPRAPGPRT